MMQPGKRLCLSLEEEKSLVRCLWINVRDGVEAHDLHGDLPTQVCILRKIDFPQRTTSKEREKSKAAPVWIIH